MTSVAHFDIKTDWSSLRIDPRLLKAIQNLNWRNPTKIQSQVIVKAMEGKDVVVCSPTGSGKSAAFIIPIIQRILQERESTYNSDGIRAVIIVPTSELAAQIKVEFQKLTTFLSKLVRCEKLGLDEPLESQRKRIKELPDVLVAIPSRLLQLMKDKDIDCSKLIVMAIDEADMLIGYGYTSDVDAIRKLLPKKIQGFMTSATMPSEVKSLAVKSLLNPVLLEVEIKDDQKALKHMVTMAKPNEKKLLLFVILKLGVVIGRTIIFVNELNTSFDLKIYLSKIGVESVVLNSSLPLNSRINIIKEYNENKFQILIASDEGEEVKDKGKMKKNTDWHLFRGIDFLNVLNIINYDCPRTATDYTHRCGRTARIDNLGVAFTMVTPKEQNTYEKLQTELKDKLEEYHWDAKLLETFRYRVDSTKNSRRMIRNEKLVEINRELLSSEILAKHFKENPQDLEYINILRKNVEEEIDDTAGIIPIYLEKPQESITPMEALEKQKNLQTLRKEELEYLKTQLTKEDFENLKKDFIIIDPLQPAKGKIYKPRKQKKNGRQRFAKTLYQKTAIQPY